MLEIENEDVDPGTIIQEIQSGFFYGERLLRPSFVGVAKKKPVKKEEKKNDDSLVNEKITPI
jgi:molecular chaperone GrpE